MLMTELFTIIEKFMLILLFNIDGLKNVLKDFISSWTEEYHLDKSLILSI